LQGLAEGKAMELLVNTCTIGVPFVNEIVQAMAARGVTVVDYPISGGPPRARAGTLSVMVSGDPASVERIRPMISLGQDANRRRRQAGRRTGAEAHQQHPFGGRLGGDGRGVRDGR
jgi:hypothetical protein